MSRRLDILVIDVCRDAEFAEEAMNRIHLSYDDETGAGYRYPGWGLRMDTYDALEIYGAIVHALMRRGRG